MLENKILSPMMDIIFKILMGSEDSKEILVDFLMRWKFTHWKCQKHERLWNVPRMRTYSIG